jgi:hypothetical protein
MRRSAPYLSTQRVAGVARAGLVESVYAHDVMTD